MRQAAVSAWGGWLFPLRGRAALVHDRAVVRRAPGPVELVAISEVHVKKKFFF